MNLPALNLDMPPFRERSHVKGAPKVTPNNPVKQGITPHAPWWPAEYMTFTFMSSINKTSLCYFAKLRNSLGYTTPWADREE